MSYQRETSVICLGDPKQSAIYFDRIIPISYLFEYLLGQDFLGMIEKYGLYGLSEKDAQKSTEDIREIVNKLAPEDFSEIKDIAEILGSLTGIKELHEVKVLGNYLEYFGNLLSGSLLIARKHFFDKSQEKLKELITGNVSEHTLRVLDSISTKMESSVNYSINTVARDSLDLLSLLYMDDVGITGAKQTFRDDIDLIPAVKSGRTKIVLPSSSLNAYDATEDDLTIYLANLNLVNTKKTEWPQIIEFRKDKEARKKLRNLRLFFQNNYEGKNFAFIQDDLNKRLEDYDHTCKDWGFETTVSTLMTVMDSRSLHATVATAFGAAIFGGPLYAAGATLAGSLLESGKVALRFAKRRHAFHKLKRDHDLAFIIEAQERLK